MKLSFNLKLFKIYQNKVCSVCVCVHVCGYADAQEYFSNCKQNKDSKRNIIFYLYVLNP